MTGSENSRGGPLRGIKVVEIGAIGPGAFCAMVLADMGAEVIRIDRVSGSALVGPNDDFQIEVMNRGRRSVAVDLKTPAGVEVVLRLADQADVLVEGFRPGVAERLGIGPEACAARNPGLVYGRMTGFGQSGPMAQAVGHDLNYVAVSGVQSLIGRFGQPPTPVLSLLGDFGGGGLLLAFGILAALLERQVSGLGQVVDASMVEGAALLATPFFGFAATGLWNRERGTNIVDSGAPFYDVYETADGKWLAVAAMERRFYDRLAALLELPDDLADLADQYDQAAWPAMKTVVAQAVKKRTRDEWLELAQGQEVCLSPVLEIDEALAYPQNVARGVFVENEGIAQPAPAPRFSRTPASLGRGPSRPGQHTLEVLAEWGIEQGALAALLEQGAIAQN